MAQTLLEEEIPDTYRVKTFLRPDIYEFLTVFSYAQLRRRKEILPFPHSTLLVPYNIRKYRKLFGSGDYFRYLYSTNTRKRALLGDVLRSTGITRAAADALTADRHTFVPLRRRRFAYLNTSTAVLGDTNISAPAVVGYMLDATRHWTSALTVEMGIGTGLHAIAMARLHPAMTILGIERNEQMLPRLAENIARSGMADRVRIVDKGREQEALWNARQVYLTAAASQEQVAKLVKMGGPNTEWLLPRQLDEREFAGEPESSWLKTQFGSYTNYVNSDDWNSYCALDAFSVDHDLKPVRRSVMYDTTFVRFIT
jgi:protein-L-isoaspartate O-methyltransferase